jgi:hypothetical protein
MKIAFCWQGFNGRYGQWKDGLWAAMKIIEKKHEVRYFEPTDDIEAFKPDWILYWEAPITATGKDADKYERVCALPFKKALMFAGGEIRPMWVKDFDHLFIESQIDMDTCERYGIPHSRAFGVNTDIFKPQLQPKVWDAMLQATCASWKRTWLMTRALKSKSMVCGRYQETDPACWERAREDGAMVLPELSAEAVNSCLNASRCVVNSAEFWGGGQRATLEAIAAGIPVIAMSDSPKNCEFLRESNYGYIVEPNVEAIKEAVEKAKHEYWNVAGAMEYIKKWTPAKYAEAILQVIENK